MSGLNTQNNFFHATVLRCEMQDGFSQIQFIMKKILRPIAVFLCLGAIMFLAGGDYEEGTPRRRAVLLNTGAIVTALVSGLYLKKTEEDGTLD